LNKEQFPCQPGSGRENRGSAPRQRASRGLKCQHIVHGVKFFISEKTGGGNLQMHEAYSAIADCLIPRLHSPAPHDIGRPATRVFAAIPARRKFILHSGLTSRLPAR
jgi:hypothetical protein